ncbi:hypothetical protein [Oceanivirga salmonicida]|uniref:hypothetical protein n=1 Tax=Oceanivirga salmonicida TaxID=1769291 RepID=UPI0018CC27E2|nr:hypothetical protein [Oceanivirga salmonicida]
MEKIIECEHLYSKEYCTVYENDNLIRFTDYSLPEMRDYNYTYIKNKSALKELIESEIKVCTTNKQKFLKIIFDIIDDKNYDLLKLNTNYIVDKIGYYSFDISKVNSIKSEKSATIKKVKQTKMVKDIFFCDLEFDCDFSRKKFYDKKNKRRRKVYLAVIHTDAYI